MSNTIDNTQGEELGDVCNIDGCKGILEKPEGCCSCSTSSYPPCGWCECGLVCSECGN